MCSHLFFIESKTLVTKSNCNCLEIIKAKRTKSFEECYLIDNGGRNIAWRLINNYDSGLWIDYKTCGTYANDHGEIFVGGMDVFNKEFTLFLVKKGTVAACRSCYVKKGDCVFF